MNAEILCVGTEILLGDIINTNAAFLSKELAGCGIGCYYQTVVGDNPERLKECLKIALERSDMVLTTGGLGPTYDDLTKETVAQYFGREMELHQPSLEAMQQFFNRFGHKMTANNEKQAHMPQGATVFANDRGTAPGLAVEGDGKTVIMMPGPPREMTAMFESQVKPWLLEKSNTTLLSHNVHMFGIGEAAMEDQLRDYMEGMTNPTIAPYAKEGEVLLRVTAAAADTAQADELMKPVLEELKQRLGKYIYGIDIETLQNALVQKLLRRGETIATAESCTGGLVSRRITDIAGASRVFGFGACTYENVMKTKLLGVSEEILAKHGAVSEETAKAMAKGVRAYAGADYGLSVTGIAGPDGGTDEKPVGLIYIGFSGPDGETVREVKLSRGYGGERDFIRTLASSYALHHAFRNIPD